jgi:hypothetical protein
VEADSRFPPVAEPVQVIRRPALAPTAAIQMKERSYCRDVAANRRNVVAHYLERSSTFTNAL